MTTVPTHSTTDDVDPLASHGLRFASARPDPEEPADAPAAPTPFGLRWIQPVHRPAEPVYRYCPERQIAVDAFGAPLAPQMKKDWTTTDYSTDGEDPPSSEEFGWEEV
ncbi:putative ATP-grasp-modified RiPP [Saccharopolyspora rosea]|uniref:ATP-grasp-modified RiPP n=1 Tax=Saccharopolyspora rosea TaxID=524884 RepID=A0ABW3FZP7_9PSEU|nr:putative ATP-grasp-modified RiPP [Saccharopolyspora rosea]